MAVKQEATVSIESNVLFLKDLRELVEKTETWADLTVVEVDATAGGQVKLETKFGNVPR